jgi:hypothetical protein
MMPACGYHLKNNKHDEKNSRNPKDAYQRVPWVKVFINGRRTILKG